MRSAGRMLNGHFCASLRWNYFIIEALEFFSLTMSMVVLDERGARAISPSFCLDMASKEAQQYVVVIKKKLKREPAGKIGVTDSIVAGWNRKPEDSG